jgi:hypothetical protein
MNYIIPVIIIIIIILIIIVIANNQNKENNNYKYQQRLASYNFSIINTVSSITDELKSIERYNFEYLHINALKATSFTMTDKTWNKSLFMLYINVNNVPFNISNNSIKPIDHVNILVNNKPISTYLYNSMILNKNISNKKYLVINNNNTTSATTVNYTKDMSYILFQNSNYNQLTILTDSLSDLLLVFYNTTINNLSIKLKSTISPTTRSYISPTTRSYISPTTRSYISPTTKAI